MTNNTQLPIHNSLHAVEATDLYQTSEWWKSIVTYQFEDSDTEETAVYLWHKAEDEDDWKRKNKYVIKTSEAWTTDREIIDDYIRGDTPDGETTKFPVSDYYTVGDGQTVFKSDGWWKAIVTVTEKGSYETHEVMVYVWQHQDDEWRRRQKYTIKRVSDWEDEQSIVNEHLSMDKSVDIDRSTDNSSNTGSVRNAGDNTDVTHDTEDEFSTLGNEIDDHLSEEFTNS